MNTEWMIPFFKEQNLLGSINEDALAESSALASEIFI
jgi:hypothetical protein